VSSHGTPTHRPHLPVDEAVVLPPPELAMRLLAYLAALEDHYGGYGVPFNASQLHPDAVASAGAWAERAWRLRRVHDHGVSVVSVTSAVPSYSLGAESAGQGVSPASSPGGPRPAAAG
jgi:hypothetical protein